MSGAQHGLCLAGLVLVSASNKVTSNSGDDTGVEQAKASHADFLSLPVISMAARGVPVTLSETPEIAHSLLILGSEMKLLFLLPT